jgi:hypothetical protein
MPHKPIAAGRRRHHPILTRDTGDENRLVAVRDQNKRREVLEREWQQAAKNPQSPVNRQTAIRQVDNPEVLKLHEYHKRQTTTNPSSTTNTLTTTRQTFTTTWPRKTWRNPTGTTTTTTT